MTYNYYVDISSWFFIIFLAGSVLSTTVNSFLDFLNLNKGDISSKIKNMYSKYPLIKKYISNAKIKKSEEYHTVNSIFGDMVSSINSGMSTFFLIMGAMPFMVHYFINTTNSITLSYIFSAIVLSLVELLIQIPTSYYDTFVIEKRFGFNNSTKMLFAIDNIKEFIIGTVLMSAFITVFNYFLTSFGKYDPLKICGLVCGFIMLEFIYEFLYMTAFIRFFNKLTPLTDKSLSAKIKNLFKKCGYSKIPKIFVMDSSKRSSHGNAFVGGIGPSKKIVIYDTLLKNHTTEEILAILAHEIGHAKNNHLLLRRVSDGIVTLITTFVIFTMIYNVNLYHAFGFNWITEENVLSYSLIGFNLSSMIIGAVMWIVSPIEAYISRKMEYTADRYSAQKTSAKAMTLALIKITADNLGDVFPDKYYETWNYDHPSLLNRIDALNTKKKSVRKNK